jgi:hypothetical protein
VSAYRDRATLRQHRISGGYLNSDFGSKPKQSRWHIIPTRHHRNKDQRIPIQSHLLQILIQHHSIPILARDLPHNRRRPKHKTIHILTQHQINQSPLLQIRTLSLCLPRRSPNLKPKRPDERFNHPPLHRIGHHPHPLIPFERRFTRAIKDKQRTHGEPKQTTETVIECAYHGIGTLLPGLDLEIPDTHVDGKHQRTAPLLQLLRR